MSDDCLQQKNEESMYSDQQLTIRDVYKIISEVPKPTIHKTVNTKLGYKKF